MGAKEVQKTIMVLVKSSSPETPKLLRQLLPPGKFEVATLENEASFIEMARRKRPDVAVIDHVDECPDAAELEIEILKEVQPDVRIIAVSEHPSPKDARVIERGLFYYLANPTAADLVRVIEAAGCGIRASPRRGFS